MSVSTDGHTVKRFDQQLASLRSLVLEMGGLVEDQINRAVQALQDEDLAGAREVVARDHVVNGFDVRADEEVVNLLALRQPMARDLREVMAAFGGVVSCLERAGQGA